MLPMPDHPQAAPRERLRTELFLVGVVLYVVCFWIHCDDHWWHMLTGRLVLETGRVPGADPFSFTFQGAPWTNWEWLAGVVMSLAWSAAGPLGLTLLRALAFGGTVLVALRHWRRLSGRHLGGLGSLEHGRELAATLVGAALLLAVQIRVADRPHTYAFLLLAGAHALTTRLRERWSTPVAAGLVALFALWVNFHPSWMLGMGLCGAILADGILADARRLGPRAALARNRGRIVLGLAIVASVLLTPNADHFYGAIADIFQKQVSGEWEPTWKFLSFTQVPLMTFSLVVLAWLVSLARTFRRRELPAAEPLQQLVLAALLVLAFRHVMLTPVFVIVAIPYLRLDLLGWGSAVRSLTRRSEILASLFLLIITLSLAQHVLGVLGTFGIGVDPRTNPVARADFMSERRLRGRVLATSKEAHGYMAFRLWPAVTIYIDGRVPQVFPVSFLETYRQIGDPRVLSREIDHYGIDHVVLVSGLYSAINNQIAAALRARGDFALVDYDENGALWSRTRNGAWPCPECRPFEILDPYRLRQRPPGERLQDTPALRAELARLDAIAARSRLARDLARGARKEVGISSTP